ncbi:MAG: glycosyltransferase family 2 protein [Nitrosopumilus sp.]|nr:glycosyltransferase family 2 protein [Nitrosopumilus sp.]
MILFSIPLLSPNNTNNYDVVIDNLKLTLRSIMDQENDAWFVSLGCDDPSIIKHLEFFPQEKIQISQINQSFHSLKQPIRSELDPVDSSLFQHSVSSNLFPKRNLDDGMHDKAFKRLISYFDIEIDYKYIFFLDGDDLVSNKLVDSLMQQSSPIIRLCNGFMADLEKQKYKSCNDLHLRCGSTIAYTREFMESIPINKLLLYLGGHLTQDKDHSVTFIDTPLIFRIHKHNFAGKLYNRHANLKNENPIDKKEFPCLKSITGITVSINFGDFLKTTLPINRLLFDDYIVVTSPEDELTQKIAKENDCILVITDRHKKDGAPLNKGCAINDGIDQCKTDWICYIDADIALTEAVKTECLDQNCLYGINRLMCESYEDWFEYRLSGKTNHLYIKDEKEGLRLAKMPSNKKYAIGYCQIWKNKKGIKYPEESHTTLFDDLHFNDRFSKVHNLDKSCIHISSSEWVRDLDSRGRKSGKWEPEMHFISQMKSPQDKKPTYRGGIMQVWIGRACDKSCFGCTQGSNLKGPYEKITTDQFETALKSLKNYWGVVGIFGGNPCIHPQFPELCEILEQYIPYEQRGLWSNNLNGHGKLCAKVFNSKVSNINSHGDKRAYDEIVENWPELVETGFPNLKPLESCSEHSPPFVAIQDLIPNEIKRWKMIVGCDINQYWSGMIAVFRGELRGWFCEIAGTQSILHQHEENYPDTGFKITPDWWDKPISDFADQVRFHCHSCGIPMRIAAKPDDTKEPELVTLTHLNVYKPKKRELKLVKDKSEIEFQEISRVTDYIKKTPIKIKELKLL